MILLFYREQTYINAIRKTRVGERDGEAVLVIISEWCHTGFVIIETRSPYIVLATLELAMKTRMASNSKGSTSFCLPSPQIKGGSHLAWRKQHGQAEVLVLRVTCFHANTQGPLTSSPYLGLRKHIDGTGNIRDVMTVFPTLAFIMG